MSKIVTPPTSELNGRLEVLRIFKTEALEQLLENEIVIQSQKERIAELEFHLGKCRDSAYLIVTATAGVLPANYAPDVKPKKKHKDKENDRN